MNWEDKWIAWAAELQSIAQAGLFYGRDVFDKERYARIREISAEMMAAKTQLPIETVKHLFCADSGYQTPKIDTRAAVFEEEKILLVKEKSGKWALPGGWCEFNMSPTENTVKEAKEEAGISVSVEKLIAVQSRSKHNEPPYPYEVVKLFYLCKNLGGSFAQNSETLGAAYFARNELPETANEKTTKAQIEMCFAAASATDWRVLFD